MGLAKGGVTGGYGSARLGLWYHGLRDRLRGDHARANARWGHVRAPAGEGRIIWFKAGSSERSVRLAAELLGALREKRLDVRLVLTFEEDHAQVLAKRLAGMAKTGFGYGPCEARHAMKRIMHRFSPLLGIVCVETPPGPNLLRQAHAAGVHVVAFDTVAGSEAQVDACYPSDVAMADVMRTTGRCAHVALPADPLSQLVAAQVEPTFRGLIGDVGVTTLAWMHFPDAPAALEAVRIWRQSPLSAESLLCISVDTDQIGLGAALAKDGTMCRLSTWSRERLAPGTVIWSDEARWYPAVAVSADLIHLRSAPREILWQALAAGVPISFSTGTSAAVLNENDAADNALGNASGEGVTGWAVDENIQACLARWQDLRERPPAARQLGDACRRRFWNERRRSAQVIEELLTRMYAW